MYPNQDYKINHPEGMQPAGGPPRKPLKPKRKMRLPLFIILILAGVIGYMYLTDKSEVDNANIGGDVVPLIKADSSPEKEKPQEPGGMDIPHQDKLVFDQMENKSDNDKDDMKVENLLPPAEQPQDLPATGGSSDQYKEIVVNEGTAAASKPVTEDITPAAPTPVAPAPEVAKVEAPKAVEPPAPVVEEKPVTIAPEVAPKAEAPVVKETGNFKAEAGGTYWLQLVSLKSVDAAQSAAKVFAKKHPSVLGQLDINVAKADVGAKGTFYRLQFGAFKQKADAQKACAALKAEKQDCIIVQN